MKRYSLVFTIIFILGGASLLSAYTNDLYLAKTAFRSHNYQEAIQGFEKNLASNPNDTTSLKYIGLSYIKLNNPAKAIEYLERAKQSAPQNSSIRYYLAEAYYLSSDTDKAKNEVDILLTEFPSNIYSTKAKFLQKKFKKRVQRRPLRLYNKVSYQFDTNVALEPKKLGIPGLNKDSSRFANYTWIELILLEQQAWWAGTNFSFYQSLHTENDSKEYNLSSFEVGPFFSFNLPVCSYDLVNRLEYRYIHDILNGHSFSRTHRLHYRVSSYVLKCLELTSFFQIDFDDFFYRGFRVNNDIFNRDAVQTQAGIRTKILLPESRYLYMGYDYTHNDSEGLNWNYERNRLFTEFVTPFLLPKLRLFVLGEYYNRYFSPFYNQFYGSTAERDENFYSFRVKMRYNVTNNSSVETSYRYSEKQSTLEEFFEYERQIFDISFIFYY